MTKRKKYWQTRYQLWVDGEMIIEIKNSNQNSDYENITAIRTHYAALILKRPFQIYKLIKSEPTAEIIPIEEPAEIKRIGARPAAEYSNKSAMGNTY